MDMPKNKYRTKLLASLKARHARGAYRAENLTAADLAWFRSPIGSGS